MKNDAPFSSTYKLNIWERLWISLPFVEIIGENLSKTISKNFSGKYYQTGGIIGNKLADGITKFSKKLTTE